MPSPRASLTRWNGITHAIVDIVDSFNEHEFFAPKVAKDLARTTSRCFSVRLVCGRRCKYSGNTTNKITSNAVTCLWCAAERNL